MDFQTNFVPNASRFFENYVNLEHKVLGVRLKPFSIFHLLWLETLGSPLFQTSEKVTLSDLEIAVLVCSSDSSAQILSRLNPKGRIKRLLKRLWHARNKRQDLRSQLKRFIAYQDDYTSLPEYEDSRNGESEEIFPWLLMHLSALIKATGWKQEYILSLPLGQVVWLNASLGYLESGKTGVISDKKRAAMAALRGMELTGQG